MSFSYRHANHSVGYLMDGGSAAPTWLGAYHKVQIFILFIGRFGQSSKVQEFIKASSSYWTEVVLSKSGQKAGTGYVYKCQRSKWPEDEVTRVKVAEVKRPEVEVARDQSGHMLKWPELEMAKGKTD